MNAVPAPTADPVDPLAHAPDASDAAAPETPDVVIGNHHDKYGDGNVLIQALTRRFLTRLDGLLDDLEAEGRPIERILEVGCGEGEIVERLAGRFPGAEITALDLPDAGLRSAWAHRVGGSFTHGDAHRLPFADDAVDLIVAVEVFEHLTNPWAGLAEMVRVSSRHLVASVPREPLFRMGNFLTGRHVGDLGNTPGHLNHWGTPGFVRFISRRAAVVDVATPVPWTMLRAHTDVR